MKDSNHHHQTPIPTPTPRKEQYQQHSRSSEMASNCSTKSLKDTTPPPSSMAIVSENSKKPDKLMKKNLNVEFTAVSEDISSPISKESELSPLSPVSEVSDVVVYSESFKDSQNPEISALPEMFDLEVTPMSKITTGYGEGSSVSVNQFRAVESECLKMKSLEAEVVAEPVEQALFQIMNSAEVDRRTKKLVEAIVDVVMEDFKGLLEERDMLSRVVTARNPILLCGFLLWIIFASVVLYMNTRVVCASFSEPPPT